MRAEGLRGSLLVLLFVAQGAWTQPAISADSLELWESLPAEDRATIQATLLQRLPEVLGEEAASYAQELANNIPQWWKLASCFDRGDYSGVMDMFADELALYMRQRLEVELPPDSVAGQVFALVRDNSGILIAIADPNTSWDDAAELLWNHVQQTLTARGQLALETAVRDLINAVTTEGQLVGYTPGDLYILAVKSWADLIRRFGAKVPAVALNGLYRQYCLARNGAGGSHFRACELVRFLWETNYVEARDGRRIPASWFAPVSGMLQRMKLEFDDLLPLFDRYWNHTQGQQHGFYQWFQERSRQRLRAIREAAVKRLAVQREAERERLANLHREVARQLRQAIDDRLSDAQKEARDKALEQAQALLDQLREQRTRYIAELEKSLEAFHAALDEMNEIHSLANRTRASLSTRRLTERIAEAREISTLGDKQAGLEARLGGIVRTIENLEAQVATAEQAAQRSCAETREITAASSKEQARQHLKDALEQGHIALEAINAGNQGIAHTRAARDSFRAWLDALGSEQHIRMQDAHWALRDLQETLTSFERAAQLEAKWHTAYAKLGSRVQRLKKIKTEITEHKDSINALLAPHHANDGILKLLKAMEGMLVAQVETIDDALKTTWENSGNRSQAWSTRKFPTFPEPDPSLLDEARKLLRDFATLATLPSLEKFEAKILAIDEDLKAIEERLQDAWFRVKGCSARAIVDYDRTWLKGDLTRVVENEATGGQTGAKVQVARNEPEVRLPPVEDEMGRNEPEVELPSVKEEMGRNEPEVELPPVEDEMGRNEPEVELPPVEDEMGRNEPEVESEPDPREEESDLPKTQPKPRPKKSTRSKKKPKPPEGKGQVVGLEDIDGEYVLYELNPATNQWMRSQFFDGLLWSSEDENRARATLILSSQFPEGLLQEHGLKKNQHLYASRLQDANGRDYFLATGSDFTDTVSAIARGLGSLVAGMGSLGTGGSTAFRVAVHRATAAVVPNETNNDLAVTVTVRFTLTAAGQQMTKEGNYRALAKKIRGNSGSGPR